MPALPAAGPGDQRSVAVQVFDERRVFGRSARVQSVEVSTLCEHSQLSSLMVFRRARPALPPNSSAVTLTNTRQVSSYPMAPLTARARRVGAEPRLAASPSELEQARTPEAEHRR